jgi:hypothetical protein
VLDIGFTDHLQVVTIYNCNTVTDFHTLPMTPAKIKSFRSAFASHFLATDFNTVTITVPLNYTPKYNCNYCTHKISPSQPDFQLSTELVAPNRPG